MLEYGRRTWKAKTVPEGFCFWLNKKKLKKLAPWSQENWSMQMFNGLTMWSKVGPQSNSVNMANL